MSGTRPVSLDLVLERAGTVRRRIEKAGGDLARVAVVAVTKGFGQDAVYAAVAAGLLDVGENYAQELVAKATALAESADDAGPPIAPRWHFIGRVQRNKVRHLAPHVTLWQSVDRAQLGTEIARRAPGARVLVQVSVAGESQQGGCSPGDAPALVAALCDAGLNVEGLMAIGATGGAEAARPGFRLLRNLAADLGLSQISMGMSGDLEVAVEEGSTMVRVGTALFGPRTDRDGMRN